MNKYFNNIQLLQNTLLPYFCVPEPLKLINKIFYSLNYEKYNTHLQPHGIIESYFPKTMTIEQRRTYVNGKLNGVSELWDEHGKSKGKCNYINDLKDGLCEMFYDTRSDETEGSNSKLWRRINYKMGKEDGLYEFWNYDGLLQLKKNFRDGKANGLSELWFTNRQLYKKYWYKNDKKKWII